MKLCNVWAGVGLMVVVCTGCGSSRPATFPVSGTVTWEGQPLPEGQIIFTPVDGSVAPDAGPIADGKFNLRAQAGLKRVEIYATRESGPPDPVMNMSPKEQYIPARYNTETTFSVEVTSSGVSDLKYDLTAAGNG